MSAVPNRDESVYWAADKPDVVQMEALDRVRKYYMDVRSSGRGNLWRRSYLAYLGLESNYGSQHAASQIRSAGDQGELLLTKVNELRSIVGHIINILTRDAPIYEPQAHDTTTESEAACDLARDLLAQFQRDQDVDGKNRRAVEWACVLGEGYLATEWDWTLGPLSKGKFGPDGNPIMDPATGKPARKPLGDVRLDVFGPHDVIHDIRTPGWDPQWLTVRRWVNRYDLIARYCNPGPEPQMGTPEAQAYGDAVKTCEKRRRAIMALDTRDKVEQATMALWTFGQTMPSEDVAVYTLYHKRTESLPGGRMFVFVDGDTWLFDGALPYEDIPVERVAMAEWLDRGYTYAPTFDLTGLQEAIDAFWTMYISTADLAGVPNFLIPDTANIGVEELSGGGREIRYRVDPKAPNGGAPSMMVVPEPPGFVMKGMEIIPGAMERLSAINSVVRGDPQENIKAGNYAALVQVQSAEYYTPAKRSDIHALERTAKHALGMYGTFCTEERAVVTEGGPRGRRLLSFTKAQLAPVKDVIATMSNPMRETTAGRLMLADTMYKQIDPRTGKPAITSSQWVEILDTGRFEPATDPIMEKTSLIEFENELIGDGCASEAECNQRIPVTPFDNHQEHLAGVEGVGGHTNLVNSPEFRTDPKKMQTLFWHVKAHQMAMMQAAMGPPGAPPPGPPGPQPGPGGPPPGPGGAEPPSAQKVASLSGGPGAADAGVRLPQPAKPPAGAGPS